MNRQLKFKQSEDSRVWLSSDFHLNHNPNWPTPIWRMRGYNSVEEMNYGIIKSVNDNVKSTDVLIYLGDFTLNCGSSQFENFLSQINCQSIYILYGNHNSCVWSTYEEQVYSQYGKKDIEIYPLNYRNLIFVGNYLEFSVDGINAIAFHYPIHSFNGQTKGRPHFYGHIHSTPETPKIEGRKMDVGFDYWKRPVSFDEAIKILDKMPIKHEGHH